jgi:hypothetical protein
MSSIGMGREKVAGISASLTMVYQSSITST